MSRERSLENPVRGGRLSAMVRRAQVNGTTYREMERRAKMRGLQVSSGYLNNLANDAVQGAPSAELCEAIAVAINVPPIVVKIAAAEQYLGLEPGKLSHAAEDLLTIVPMPEDATVDDRRELQNMVSAWWAARRRHPND